MTWISKRDDCNKAEAEAGKKQARVMLARAIPFSQWRIGRSAEDTRMYLLIMRGTMKVADLAPEEHKAESARLELDAAIAFAEGSEH
jgi:hypothetical protein